MGGREDEKRNFGYSLSESGVEMAVPEDNTYLLWTSSSQPLAEILWREWEDFSTQPDAQGLEAGDGPQFQFTLMSYNILAQDLMQQSSELYLHCHPDILNWNYRFANLMQEFQHWDPDVSEEGKKCPLVFALNPIVVYRIGVLPRAGAFLPEVSEFLAGAEKTVGTHFPAPLCREGDLRDSRSGKIQCMHLVYSA